MDDSLKEKDYLDKVNPDRREFVKKMVGIAFVPAAVVSVSMLDQRLNVSAAMAQTSNLSPSK